MIADINKIEFLKSDSVYEIYTEYADYPIESFETEDEAIRFVTGYKSEFFETNDEVLLQGMMFRKMIEDENKEEPLKKINELNELTYV